MSLGTSSAKDFNPTKIPLKRGIFDTVSRLEGRRGRLLRVELTDNTTVDEAFEAAEGEAVADGVQVQILNEH